MTRRTRQVGELLREELTDIIRKEMDDPRLAFWSITRVDVPTDLRSARVYISVLGTDGERAATLAAALRCWIHPAAPQAPPTHAANPRTRISGRSLARACCGDLQNFARSWRGRIIG